MFLSISFLLSSILFSFWQRPFLFISQKLRLDSNTFLLSLFGGAIFLYLFRVQTYLEDTSQDLLKWIFPPARSSRSWCGTTSTVRIFDFQIPPELYKWVALSLTVLFFIIAIYFYKSPAQ